VGPQTDMRVIIPARALVVAICMALIPSPAAPAEFTRRGSVIYITGEIGADEYLDYMQVRGDLRHGTVVLNSLGGYLMAAMMIGGNLRERQFDTVVRSGDVCSSVCPLIWLAGKPRYLGRLAKLGFHSAGYPDQPGVRSERGNQMIADYFKRIGVPQQVIDLQPMADPGPCCLNYVDYMQAKVWGLLKERPTKQELQEVADRKTVWLKPSPSPFPDPPPPGGQSIIPSGTPLVPWSVAPK
jgi:hypothetical protein